jgi:hypothetical protein
VLQVRDIVHLIRTNPSGLIMAFAVTVLIRVFSVLAVPVIAEALNIGCLSMADVLFAVPLTLAANALPLTPNAIGVGETAFDQICRWMESEPSGGRLFEYFLCLPNRFDAGFACSASFLPAVSQAPSESC